MKLVKECSFENKNSYGVIYQEGIVQKIILINDLETYGIDLDKELESIGSLEIRTCDFDMGTDKLSFTDGFLSSYEDGYEFRSRGKMTDAEANLKYFAKEFQFAFETNPNLKRHLPIVFRELVDYFEFE